MGIMIPNWIKDSCKGFLIILVLFAIAYLCLIGPRIYYLMTEPPSREYKSGEIEVLFYPNITLSKAAQIVEEYNCTVVYASVSDDGIKCIVAVPEGKEMEYVEKFKSNIYVKDAHLVVLYG